MTPFLVLSIPLAFNNLDSTLISLVRIKQRDEHVANLPNIKMHSKISICTLLGVASLGRAATDVVTLAYGQQIQNNDSANHWVVWTEGHNACPGQTVLGPLYLPACNQTFVVGTGTYSFGGCDGTTEPSVLLDNNNVTIGICSSDLDKIGCSSSNEHDIVKHGVC
ncbi:hypothetical protein F5Y16DRAFT_380867 [Xylariaceae sp. FL0255]|nr:hypothetical protein F5Y16DRAFT_380867 [Xylariaceae sp. FL0255]